MYKYLVLNKLSRSMQKSIGSVKECIREGNETEWNEFLGWRGKGERCKQCNGDTENGSEVKVAPQRHGKATVMPSYGEKIVPRSSTENC